MEMTFQQYIDNPMGKRNAVFSQREVFKNIYTEKFDKVFLREAGKINYTLYMDKKKDQYIIHIKVPSETVKDFYYDAVILFYTNDAAKRSSPSLQDYFVKFFSNDPAFVYTYLYVFLNNNLFIEDLKPKSSKLALKNKHKEKNHYGVTVYSKILYFAFLFMKSKNLFAKHFYSSYGVNYTAKKLLDNVEHTDKKISDRQEAGEKQAKEIAREKKKASESKQKQTNGISNGSNRNVSIIKPVGRIKTISSSKTVPKVKTVKRSNKK